jgi:hypothetical protein
MSVTLRKEWIGESGYCNCLLVVMSRMSIHQVELFSDQPPPDLEALTTRPDTLAWLQAQEFDFSALDTTEIIETLATSAGIKKSFWRYKRESTDFIQAYDCVEDDGPEVERRFSLRLLRSGSKLYLTVVLDTPQSPT